MNRDWAVNRDFAGEDEAERARMVLEGSGIRVLVTRGDCGGWRPALQAGAGFQLLVSRAEVPRALDILQATGNA